MIKWVAIR